MVDNPEQQEIDVSYYSEEQRDLKQRVWDNWRYGNGRCSDCPMRTPQLRPEHAAFSTDAEVMAVAEAPGEGRGGNREVKENQLQFEPGEWESIRSQPRFTEYDRDLAEKWSVPGGEAYSWPYVHELLRKERLPLGPTDVFFTNAIKCGKTDFNQLDSKARSHCASYLEYEISELVQPRVVVAFGDHAIKAVEEVLDLEIVSGSISHTLNAAQSEDTFPVFGDDPIVIPSYHWSRLGSNVSQHLEWIDTNGVDRGYESSYWDKLAERIRSVL